MPSATITQIKPTDYTDKIGEIILYYLCNHRVSVLILNHEN